VKKEPGERRKKPSSSANLPGPVFSFCGGAEDTVLSLPYEPTKPFSERADLPWMGPTLLAHSLLSPHTTLRAPKNFPIFHEVFHNILWWMETLSTRVQKYLGKFRF